MIGNHEPSWWLRCRLSEIDRASINGGMTSCVHIPARPGIVSLWSPDGVWCLQCAPEHNLKVEAGDAYRCDRCDKVDEEINLCTISGRLAVVVFGLCPSCFAREAAA